jgi:DNA-binding transcriptional regulator YhcF (GntR family)
MQEPYEGEYETQDILEAVKTSLSRMKVNELKSFASEHGIDISGLKAKGDLVDAIALYPGIARILGLDHDGSAEESDFGFLEEAEEIAQEAPPEVPPEPEERAEPTALSERVRQALRASVDFSVLEHFLSEAATKFKERSYDAAVQTAKESVFKIEERVRDYVEASWAFAIASAQRILETSSRTSKAAKEAKKALDEAMEAFKDGTFLRSPELLERLSAAALNLYSYEMDRAREHVEAQRRALEEIQAMGGDITAASTMLNRAAGALEENDRASYLELVEEADALVRKAREDRIEEIKEAADSVEAIIEEARSIGADVSEASKLLKDVRKAIESEDFISANDLISNAEQVALEAQKAHMDRVAQMRDKQIEKVKELIAQIKPLIDKARTEGFQAGEAIEDLKAAVEHVNAGDYVNALLRAKKAYQAVKAFKSQVEAQKLQSAPVKTEETIEIAGTEPEEEPENPSHICVHCGSTNVEVGFKGRARCLACGKRFRI